MMYQMKSGNWMNVLRLMGLTNKVKFICDIEGSGIENYLEKHKKSNEKCQLNESCSSNRGA